tara:strand:- start:3799 stop:5781 length:1983 start_codon:yes stop_codon:yes gene_type:complete
MGYKKNPFNSAKGREIVDNIFDLMFIPEEHNPNKIEKEDKQRQVLFYKGNIINIVNKMRKFVTGYQQIPISESGSSGIHVCPHCRRRDFIWHWDVVDGGHYNNPDHWNDTVEPGLWKGKMMGEKDRYCFVLRYRCNNVTTCQKCHTTVRDDTHSINSCPNCGNTEKDPSNPNALVRAGCGEESYSSHFVREYTMRNNIPSKFDEAMGAIQRNRQIRVGRKIMEGKLSGYEIKHDNRPNNGEIVTTFQQIKRYTPSVIFTYSAQDEVIESEYPLSELNYAFSKQLIKRCKLGKMDKGVYYHPQTPYLLKDNRGDPLPSCPYCGAEDSPTVLEIPGLYYTPRVMKLMNPQPLSSESMSGLTYRGQPVYNLYLESSVNDEYKLLLPLPQMNTLRPIPEEPTIQQTSIGFSPCPNDVGMGVMVEDILNNANEKLQNAQKELSGAMKEKFGLGPADAQTSNGFTYLIAEGRSRSAKLDSLSGKWIDYSPDCKSYRSKEGATLTTPRSYPRWNHVPTYADPTSTHNKYLGPNPETHIVMDWLRVSQNVSVFVASPIPYHTTQQVGEIINDDIGKRTSIMECLTCKGAVKANGIMNYRISTGQLAPDGSVLGNFPQAVIDAELKYENNYPLENNRGQPMPIAWGIIASGDHNGKKMLENPSRRIRID